MLSPLLRHLSLVVTLTTFTVLFSYSQYRRPSTVVPGSTQDKIFDNADRIHREATQKPASTSKPVTNTSNNKPAASTNTTPNKVISAPEPVKAEPGYFQREAGACVCNAKPLSEVKFVVTDNGAVNYFSTVAKGFVMKSRAGKDYIVAVPEYNGSSSLLNRRYDVYYVNYTSSASSGQINTGKRMFYLDPTEVRSFFNDRYSGQELQDLERRVMEKIAPFFKQGFKVQFKVNTGTVTTSLTGYQLYIKLRDSVFIAVPDPKASNKGNIYSLNLSGNYYNETAVLFMPYEMSLKDAKDFELIGDLVNNKFSLQTNAWVRTRQTMEDQEIIRTKPVYAANKIFNTTIETAAPYTLMKYAISPDIRLDSGYKLNFAAKTAS
jgi:hypothetical protein